MLKLYTFFNIIQKQIVIDYKINSHIFIQNDFYVFFMYLKFEFISIKSIVISIYKKSYFVFLIFI